MTEALPSGSAEAEEQLIAGGKVMSIWEHLSELRGRLVKSVCCGDLSRGISSDRFDVFR